MLVIDPSWVGEECVLGQVISMISGMFPIAITRIINEYHIFRVEQNPLVSSFHWFQMAKISKILRIPPKLSHRSRNPTSPICSAAAREGNGVVGETWHQRPKRLSTNTLRDHFLKWTMDHEWRCISCWKREFSMGHLGVPELTVSIETNLNLMSSSTNMPVSSWN